MEGETMPILKLLKELLSKTRDHNAGIYQQLADLLKERDARAMQRLLDKQGVYTELEESLGSFVSRLEDGERTPEVTAKSAPVLSARPKPKSPKGAAKKDKAATEKKQPEYLVKRERTEAIRQLLLNKPGITNEAIIKTLKRQGIKVEPFNIGAVKNHLTRARKAGASGPAEVERIKDEAIRRRLALDWNGDIKKIARLVAVETGLSTTPDNVKVVKEAMTKAGQIPGQNQKKGRGSLRSSIETRAGEALASLTIDPETRQRLNEDVREVIREGFTQIEDVTTQLKERGWKNITRTRPIITEIFDQELRRSTLGHRPGN